MYHGGGMKPKVKGKGKMSKKSEMMKRLKMLKDKASKKKM